MGGQNGRRNSYQKIQIHSGNFRGTALITISAVETDDDFSIHPHVIVGGENVSKGPIFVKRIEIEQESTVVDIRVAIVSTKREDSRETLDLIQTAHRNFGLDEQNLTYEPCDQRYNLNAVKLRFQVKFLEGINGYLLTPKISNQIRIGTLVIKTISDNVALKHKGKKIIIVCEKLRLKRDEKIIPEFSYFDQGNQIIPPVIRDKIKCYDGVAISFMTPEFSNESPIVNATLYIYIAKEVPGRVVEIIDRS